MFNKVKINDQILINDDCLHIFPYLQAKNQKFDAIICDPPYKVLNSKCGWDNIIPLDTMWDWLLQLRRDETTPIILFSMEPFTSKLITSQPKLFKYKWYWSKTASTGFLNTKKQPMRCIEEILVFYEKQCLYNPQKTQGHPPTNTYTKRAEVANKSMVYGNNKQDISGGGETDRYPKQLLTFKSDKQKSCLHPTQKPLELMEYLVKTHTNDGGKVLDFASGSGTTAHACMNLGRRSISVEKEEEYYLKSIERLSK